MFIAVFSFINPPLGSSSAKYLFKVAILCLFSVLYVKFLIYVLDKTLKNKTLQNNPINPEMIRYEELSRTCMGTYSLKYKCYRAYIITITWLTVNLSVSEVA